MSIHVFQGATRQQLTDLKIPDTVAFGDDLGASSKEGAPITAGLFRIGKGQSMPYSYDFDEFKLVLEGEITVKDQANGQVYELKAGDVIQFPAGTKVSYSSHSSGLAFYVAQR
ncbi:cupin domain-containing protein [Polaromonas jejuensis]|uniref:Cupin domain-containing protein n=1 Tax=Polaromonas jejuensis TaxID=457502 RepID=A0ABW0QA85_9BURK|nr:cupin domain-containing protein [Polaromonas jejuensis]